MTITAERQRDVDFTKPFYDFRISLIMQNPGEPAMDLFAFLLPFNGKVWLSMIGVVSRAHRAYLVSVYIARFHQFRPSHPVSICSFLFSPTITKTSCPRLSFSS